MTSSTTTSPFARRVEPVAVLSTIRSASSGGKTSVAPKVLRTRASRPFDAIQRSVSRTYSVAMTRGRRGSSFPGPTSSRGAAATIRTGSSPVSRTSTGRSAASSSPVSSTQSSPAKPASRAPTRSIWTMFWGLRSFAVAPGSETVGR